MTDPALISRPLSYKNEDSAKRIVSDGGLKFARPSISAGGKKFVWPVGIEGFEVAGTATLGIHHYIGANQVDVHVIHFNDGRITISGTLPGLTSPGNMVNLEDILISRNKKILRLPGVLLREQYVAVESHNFTHAADDRTSSIDYTITFVRVGLGSSVGASGGKGAALAFQASQVATASPATAQRGATSQSSRTFSVTAGVDTLRAIAAQVYGDVDQWPQLVTLNIDQIANNNPGLSVRPDQMAYFRWPVGTLVRY